MQDGSVQQRIEDFIYVGSETMGELFADFADILDGSGRRSQSQGKSQACFKKKKMVQYGVFIGHT